MASISFTTTKEVKSTLLNHAKKEKRSLSSLVHKIVSEWAEANERKTDNS